MRDARTYYVQLQPRGARPGRQHALAGVAKVEARFAMDAKRIADRLSPHTEECYVIGTAEEVDRGGRNE